MEESYVPSLETSSSSSWSQRGSHERYEDISLSNHLKQTRGRRRLKWKGRSEDDRIVREWEVEELDQYRRWIRGDKSVVTRVERCEVANKTEAG